MYTHTHAVQTCVIKRSTLVGKYFIVWLYYSVLSQSPIDGHLSPPPPHPPQLFCY